MTCAQYVDRMKRDGEWGDGPMLEVMVKMFQKPISILQSDGQTILLTSPNLLDTKPIHLGYVAMGPGPRNHYVGLKKIINCELADTVGKQDELHTPGVDSKQETVNQQQIRQCVYSFQCGIFTPTSILLIIKIHRSRCNFFTGCTD